MKDVVYTWLGVKKFDNEKFLTPCDYNYDSLAYNSYFTKPGRYFKNTLWGSPVDENKYFTWRKWCEENSFRNNKFYKNFKLKEDAKILTIDSYISLYEFFKEYGLFDQKELKEIEEFCNLCKSFYTEKKYEKLSKYDKEYIEDGITNKLYDDIQDIIYSKEKIIKSWDEIYRRYDGMEVIHFDYNVVHTFFNTWDCDSICVWNKNKIILLEEGELC